MNRDNKNARSLTGEKGPYRQLPIQMEYLNWLKNSAGSLGTVDEYVSKNFTGKKESSPTSNDTNEKRPFLSVVTRTQGNRPLALAETLLCLSGQTNTDFEIIIVGHRLTSERQAVVKQVLDDVPDWLRENIRFVKVDDGNRTKPLHVGFLEARGEYIAILDDDDLVFDNWVETFYQLAREHPGMVLHAFSVIQEWEQASMDIGDALKSTSSHQKKYCIEFNIIKQLYDNFCPSMSYAIPGYVYREMEIHFDQSLTVLEDWDFLMRSSLLCGVCDAPIVTSIYRKWSNLENSRSLHDEAEWKKTKKAVIEKMNELPIVLPPGYANKINDIFSEEEKRIRRTPELFLDDGSGFTEELKLTADDDADCADCWIFSSFPPVLFTTIRIDPGEDGMFILSDLKIEYTGEEGIKRELNTALLETNGIISKKGILFLKDDPQIVFRFDRKLSLRSLIIRYHASGITFSDLSHAGIRQSFLRRLKDHIGIFIFKLNRKMRRVLRREPMA